MHINGRCRIFLSLLSLSLTTALSAQQTASKRTLIRAGHIIDVHTGSETADQTIIVAGDRIVAVASTKSTPAQAGDKEIDLHGMTVLPGLIDVHTHLTADTNFDPYHELSTTVAKSALIGAR